MKHFKLPLIIVLAVLIIFEICDGHSLYKSDTKVDRSDEQHEHITNLVKPSEIRVPTFAEIAYYVRKNDDEAEKDFLQRDMKVSDESPDDEEDGAPTEARQNVLTYSELIRRLAAWEEENHKQYYDVSNVLETKN